MIVHVLGNGPSIHCFEADLFHDEPKGVRVSCNWGHPHLNCEFTACDDIFIWNLCERNIYFTTPIVCQQEQLNKVKAVTQNPQHLLKLNFKLAPHSIRNLFSMGMSSGHLAAACSIVWYQPSTLHLWGMDSFWTNDCTSIHDAKGAKKSHYIHLWKRFWIEIFSTNPKIQFVIHTPTPIENLPKNVLNERL